MEKNVQFHKLSVAALLLAAGSALVVASIELELSPINFAIVLLVGLTVMLGTYLRNKISKIDLHSILSIALFAISLYLYGGAAAVLIVAIEFVASAIILRRFRQGLPLSPILIDFSVDILAATISWQATSAILGSGERLRERADIVSFVWLVSVSTLFLYAAKSTLIWLLARFASFNKISDGLGETLRRISIKFFAGGIVAIASVSMLQVVNVYVLAIIAGLFGTAFWAYNRYVSDIQITAHLSRSRERQRAETAESQIQQLEQYVEELERTSTLLQESHESFRHAAYHDALTGLPNRNYYIDTLKTLLLQIRESTESNFAILLLDLTRFKTINDSLGHSTGDRLIRSVGKRIAHMVREDDMVARFSGDKFGIILTDLLMKDEATAFGDRLSKRIAEPYTLDGRQVFTNVKIGIAYGNSKYAEAEDILRDADIAMYYAKDSGEDQVVFDQKMHIRAVTRLQLETDLRFAIERNEFELFYQPIIEISNASLVGFEALVRWNHPLRGLVPPNEFIPISESTGLIVPMTMQILHSACSQVAKWQSAHRGEVPLSIAVNLSGKHFAHPNLVEQINTVLEETGLDPRSLKLELTESAVMENAETAILMLKQIKETGVQISIDDFGTGYSSLSYLHKFPIDLLKVDRSFVSAMENHAENSEIVRTVIALARTLNLKVVAEGIESIDQFHMLRVLGCEYGQGYLFSKPLPVKEAEKLLTDKKRWLHVLPEQTKPLIQHNTESAGLRFVQ